MEPSTVEATDLHDHAKDGVASGPSDPLVVPPRDDTDEGRSNPFGPQSQPEQTQRFQSADVKIDRPSTLDVDNQGENSIEEILHDSPSDEDDDGRRPDPSILNAAAVATPSKAQSMNQEKIEKATSFLRNADILDLPIAVKRKYLESNAGMTNDEIDAALELANDAGARGRAKSGEQREGRKEKAGADLDRLEKWRPSGDDDILEEGWERDAVGPSNLGRGGRGGGHLSRRRPDDDYEFDRGDGGHRRPAPGPYFDERDPYDRWEGHPRRRYGHPSRERRIPYAEPRYHDSNLGNHTSVTDYGQLQGGERPREDTINDDESSSFFSLPAWAGGFSLGVFCLAALRWLNGGDFVLFPPPSTTETLGMSQQSRADMAEKEEGRHFLVGKGEADRI